MKRINLAGQSFGYWKVQDNYIYENNQKKWLCECRCGTEKYVYARNLLSGNSKRFFLNYGYYELKAGMKILAFSLK